MISCRNKAKSCRILCWFRKGCEGVMISFFFVFSLEVAKFFVFLQRGRIFPHVILYFKLLRLWTRIWITGIVDLCDFRTKWAFLCPKSLWIIEILLSLHRIWPMKYSELHRRFVKAGWTFDHAEGSHYFYTKDGVMTEPIPYHGSHEIGKGLANKLIRKYNV